MEVWRQQTRPTATTRRITPTARRNLYVLTDTPERRYRGTHRREPAEAAAEAPRHPDPRLRTDQGRSGREDRPDRPELPPGLEGSRRGGPRGLRDLHPGDPRRGRRLPPRLGRRDAPALHERARDHPRGRAPAGEPGELREP